MPLKSGIINATNFYPRPPRGGRPKPVISAILKDEISIHALREEGDMAVSGRAGRPRPISIHALREEGELHRVVQV